MTWQDDLAFAKDAREFLRLERQCSQLLLKRCPFQKCKAGHYFFTVFAVGVLLQESCVAVVVAATKDDLAAVIIEEVQLEGFCALLVMYIRSDLKPRLTSDLAISAVLPRPNINKVEQSPATSKPTREVFQLRRRVDETSLGTHLCQTFEIGIDADYHLRIRRTFENACGGPLKHHFVESSSCLLATILTLIQEVIVEDHAITVNENKDVRVTILGKDAVRVLSIADGT